MTCQENWKVINLLRVCQEIGGEDFEEHKVYKEWEYQMENRSMGNDRANFEEVGINKKTPLINEFLLANGFKKGEEVLYWVCW